MALIQLRDCKFNLIDGASHYMTIKIGNGTCNYSTKQNIEYDLDRGLLDQTRLGDDVPCEVNFDFVYEFITGNTTGNLTPIDVLTQSTQAFAAGWVTSDQSDACQPYSVDIQIIHAPPCPGVEEEQTYFSLFRYDELSYDFKAASISLKGRCNQSAPVVTRGTFVPGASATVYPD